MSNPLILAHRGASSVRFENTMAAFERAYEDGADGIELDVQVTEDGIPIVIHDPDFARVAGIRRSVSSVTGVEVEAFRVGKRFFRILMGHPIPTLLETVTFCHQRNLVLNVELKETVSESPDSIGRILSDLSILEHVHISSFDYGVLEKVKQLDPEMETAYLLRKKGVDWDRLDRYQCADGFHLHKRLLKEPYLGKLMATGKVLRVYGVTGNEPMTFQPPSYIGGWITDFPKRFINRKRT
ncbi:glycerophosphodiester phosphodiesterase family protein [Sporosarcina sp. FSL W7-1349]|uniref:glycerophosphodiester phosphodiesterase n=1 Tax=Sporosarcina sp. FSL W7-1349 TaxID=2921561 RepID=UPI0030F4C930